MRAQVTLTVSEGKRIIAKGIKNLTLIKSALIDGKIILKSGTTVSAISEELLNVPLGICGRISAKGTKCSKNPLDTAHCVLIDKGEAIDISDEEKFEEGALSLHEGDLLITGANIFDVYGNAAMMAGSPLGNYPGKIIPALNSEGVNIIIATGLEKLSPIPISESIKAAGRKTIGISFGMAVGLIPIQGEIIHEQIAIELLANVRATVIGRGGIMGGEGSTTMAVEGTQEEVCKIVDIIKKIKGASTSGSTESLVECSRGSAGCRVDLACMYKKGLL